MNISSHNNWFSRHKIIFLASVSVVILTVCIKMLAMPSQASTSTSASQNARSVSVSPMPTVKDEIARKLTILLNTHPRKIVKKDLVSLIAAKKVCLDAGQMLGGVHKHGVTTIGYAADGCLTLYVPWGLLKDPRYTNDMLRSVLLHETVHIFQVLRGTLAKELLQATVLGKTKIEMLVKSEFEAYLEQCKFEAERRLPEPHYFCKEYFAGGDTALLRLIVLTYVK